MKAWRVEKDKDGCVSIVDAEGRTVSVFYGIGWDDRIPFEEAERNARRMVALSHCYLHEERAVWAYGLLGLLCGVWGVFMGVGVLRWLGWV